MTEKTLKLLSDLLNGFEATIVDVKRQIIEHVDVDSTEKPEWNPDKIEWNPTEGPKGFYETTEDPANPDYQNLLRDLKAHNSKLRKDDYFYWIFSQKPTVIGRKQLTSG